MTLTVVCLGLIFGTPSQFGVVFIWRIRTILSAILHPQDEPFRAIATPRAVVSSLTSELTGHLLITNPAY
mgnify:CR=1